MKKIIAICILVTQFIYSQDNEKKIWDLLLTNKRLEARKLFDKELKSQSNTKMDIYLLDNILKLESGQINFDTTFVKGFSKFPESKNYLCSIFKTPFVVNDLQTLGFTDLIYSKIDYLATEPVLKDNPIVIYNKAIADRNRKDYLGYNKHIKLLNAIENWQLCGVFENLNDSGIETEYEPEIYPKSDKIFDANSNGKVGWYNPTITQNEGYHTFSNENEYGNGIMYSQIFVENPIERDVVFNFGMSASIKIFVNDVEVYVNTLNKMSDLNAFKLKVKLPKGMNRILIKSSISNGNNYFFLALTDIQNNKMNDLVYFDTYKDYNISSIATLGVEELSIDFENYLISKIKDNPTKELYKFLLFDAYMHNKKLELAHNIIDELDKKYPNSSMIKVRLANYYSIKDDNAKVQEIHKNIELQDADYYYTLLTKILDRDWLKTVNIVELEKMRDKAKLFPSPIIGILFDFLVNARNSKISEMMINIDQILEKSNNSEFYLTTFAPLYDSLEKKKEKTIKMLEDLVGRSENVSAASLLVNYYRDANRKDDEKKLLVDRIKSTPYFAEVTADYINFLIMDKKYEEALVEIDKSLGLFPYSFSLLEKKGMVYNYMANLKEAEKYIRLSLVHNSENSKLRKQLYDIIKMPDEIEQVATKDIYKIIKERRNCKLKGNYGVAVLLDEYIVNILPEGGRKSKILFLYEITQENGIEEMKEYNLSSYFTLLKSEVVRADGSILPAEKGDGTLVFSDLKIGDVIYIEYEDFDSNSGRFYKDFNLGCYFNSVYPSVEVIFALIHPTEMQYLTSFKNGNIPSTTKKINTKTCTIWKTNNVPPTPLNEDFSFPYSDLTNSVKVSTIKSWKEISNWYSDLVKKNLELDKITKNTFQEIFPNGVTMLSQDQIARKIYAYIEDNITYSSLDFRQSGYVPQKPSKTITTKLGDCKDVSTLFVALSKYAGLKSNLVLVSTNDNGFKNMPLPALDFNHCIAKVTIDNKDYFLELTDKYLPFKALPRTLYKANALVISFDKAENENSKLISINFENVTNSKVVTTSTVEISDNSKKFVNQNTLFGSLKSYYNGLFSDATSDDVRKKELEDLYNSRLKKNVSLQSNKLLTEDNYSDYITFETQFTITERIQSVGSLKITNLPFLDKVITRDIIAAETRNYDINYPSYEDSNEYDSEIILKIEDGKKFTEIPESKSFKYKNHEYSIKFELEKPNVLKVKRIVKTSWDSILKEEYNEFKKYVEEIISIEEQIIGFK